MSVSALAQELGWSKVPVGPFATALELLLDDEFDRLKPGERAAFLTQVRAQAPAVEGTQLAVCGVCACATLPRYLAEGRRCRACGALVSVSETQKAEDSGFGFVLADYGKTGATLLSEPPADPPGGRLELNEARGLDEALELEADNQDWDELQDEIVARRLAAEQAKREAEERAKREAEERVARAAAEAARLKAEEEARAKAAEQARVAAAEAARVKAEEETRLAAEAEAERKRKAAEAEAERKRKAAEAEAERKRLAAEAAAEAERAAAEAERLRIAELEKARPALGCVAGARAGEVIRVPDLGEDAGDTAVYVVGWPERADARLVVGKTPAQVDGKSVKGEVELSLGSVLVIGAEAYVIEETQEMGSQQAGALHLARNDKAPGGPWPYWNEEVQLGAKGSCAINVVDDGVADVHARVLTRFGVAVLEDLSGQAAEDGVYVGAEREPWVLLADGVTFKLGPKGPELIAKEGEARQAAGQKAKAMKPARHNRTVFEVYDADDELLQRVFVFVRREVRFGAMEKSPEDETRLINEWVLVPSPEEDAEIAEKQGGLALTKDGVDVRRDGGAAMRLNGDELLPGQPRPLERRFDLEVGERMAFEGRAYRSPTAVERALGPPSLGMKGGHPFECVRLDRIDTDHTYVFLVRLLRIGSEPFAPLRVDLPGVEEAHCQIMFSQGKFMIVAPRASASVFLGEVEVDPGIAFPLEINTDIHIGEARLRFREAEEKDFHFSG